MAKIVVDYQELYKLAKEIKIIYQKLEKISLKAGRYTGDLLLNKDCFVGHKTYGADLSRLGNYRKLGDVYVYLMQVASDFENIEKRITNMNGQPYVCNQTDIIEFANKLYSKLVFYQYMEGNDYQYSNYDIAKLVIASMVQTFSGDLEILDYEKSIIKKELANALEMVTNEKESDFEVTDTQKKVVNWICSGDYLGEEAKKENKELIIYGQKFASLLVNHTEDYMKIFLSEYTKSVNILNSFKEMNMDNEALNEAIDEMILEYSDNLYATMQQAKEDGIEWTVDKMVSEVSVLKYAKETIKIADKVTGSSSYAVHGKAIAASQMILGDFNDQYYKTIEAIQNGDHSKKTLDNAQNLFYTVKSMRLNQYEHVLAVEKDAIKQGQLVKEINEIKNMEMTPYNFE